MIGTTISYLSPLSAQSMPDYRDSSGRSVVSRSFIIRIVWIFRVGSLVFHHMLTSVNIWGMWHKIPPE